MDFDQTTLYFDDPESPEVERLIAEAGAGYGSDETESLLLRACLLAPGQLMVLVALYRYYFYQHRLDDALLVGDRTLAVVGAAAGISGQVAAAASQANLGRCRDAFHRPGALLPDGAEGDGLHQSASRPRDAGRSHAGQADRMDSHDRLGGKNLLQVYQTALQEEAAA